MCDSVSIQKDSKFLHNRSIRIKYMYTSLSQILFWKDSAIPSISLLVLLFIISLSFFLDIFLLTISLALDKI